MGINKKRIAQRQEAEKQAEKKARQKKWGTIGGICLGAVAVIVLAVVIILALPKNQDDAPLKADTVYYADIIIKDYGTITVKLDHSAAPITCQNFVDLANKGYYKGLTFHRIIEDFMMQGGAGEETPSIKGEFAQNGVENPLKHIRGTISMARASDPDSASSQFFIVHQTNTTNTLSLDGQYAAFGTVTSGMEIVDKICTEAEPVDDQGSIATDKQPVIENIVIRTK